MQLIAIHYNRTLLCPLISTRPLHLAIYYLSFDNAKGPSYYSNPSLD